jgi:uncharacterized protein YcfL
MMKRIFALIFLSLMLIACSSKSPAQLNKPLSAHEKALQMWNPFAKNKTVERKSSRKNSWLYNTTSREQRFQWGMQPYRG